MEAQQQTQQETKKEEVPELSELMTRRIEEVNAQIDELAAVKVRMKCSRGEECPCGGLGYINIVMVPELMKSKVSLNGVIKVGTRIKLIPCPHNDFEAREKHRLHAENVSASRIGLQALNGLSQLSRQMNREHEMIYGATIPGMLQRLWAWSVAVVKTVWMLVNQLANRIGGVPEAPKKEGAHV